MNNENTCAHEGCMCEVSGENEYCSDFCRNAAGGSQGDQKCNCGHSGCM